MLQTNDLTSNSFNIEKVNNIKILLVRAKKELSYAKFISTNTDDYFIFISYEEHFNNLYEQLNIIESNKIIRSNDKINKWQFFLGALGIALGGYYGYTGATSSSQEKSDTNIVNNLEAINNQTEVLKKLNIKSNDNNKQIKAIYKEVKLIRDKNITCYECNKLQENK